MKQETDKTKKQRQSANVKTIRHTCGTLSYLAECRGATRKACSARWSAPPDGIDSIIRK